MKDTSYLTLMVELMGVSHQFLKEKWLWDIERALFIYSYLQPVTDSSKVAANWIKDWQHSCGEFISDQDVISQVAFSSLY